MDSRETRSQWPGFAFQESIFLSEEAVALSRLGENLWPVKRYISAIALLLPVGN